MENNYCFNKKTIITKTIMFNQAKKNEAKHY